MKHWKKIVAFIAGSLLLFLFAMPALEWNEITLGIAVAILGTVVGLSGRFKLMLKQALISDERRWCDIKDRQQLLLELREELAVSDGVDLTDSKLSLVFLRRGHVGVGSVSREGGSKKWFAFNPAEKGKILLLSGLLEFEELCRLFGIRSIPQSSEKFVPTVDGQQVEKETKEESEEKNVD